MINEFVASPAGVPPPLGLLLGSLQAAEFQAGRRSSSADTSAGVLLVLSGTGRRAIDELDQRLSRLARELTPEAPIVIQGASRWARLFSALFGRWRGAQAMAATSPRTVACSVGPQAVRRLLHHHGFQVTACFEAQAPDGAVHRLDRLESPSLSWAPEFVIAASRQPSRSHVGLYRAMDAMGPGVADGDLACLMHSTRGKSIVFASNARGKAIVRVAYDPAIRKDEARGHALLKMLRERPEVRHRVPAPLGEHCGAQFDAYAQRQATGTPLSALLHRSNRSRWLPEVRRFWLDLHAGLASQVKGAVKDQSGPTTPVPMIEFVLQHVQDPVLQAEATQLVRQLLDGAVSRLGVVHGDFGAGNLLFHADRLSAVVDWEAGRDGAPPVLDVINYMDSVHRACERTDLATSLELLFSGHWPQPDEARFLSEAFELCDIAPRQRAGFVLLYFIFHIGPQLRFVATESGPIRRLHQVLRRLVALAVAPPPHGRSA